MGHFPLMNLQPVPRSVSMISSCRDREHALTGSSVQVLALSTPVQIEIEAIVLIPAETPNEGN